VTFNAYEETSQKSMKAAAEEVQSKTFRDDVDHDKSSIVNTRVSGDCAWQNRRYPSLNGVVTVIWKVC